MKTYIQYKFACTPLQPLADLLTSSLADAGFESFAEAEGGFEAYIPEGMIDDEEVVQAAIAAWSDVGKTTYTRHTIEGQNWNALWEADYPTVQVGDRMLVRAPFHKLQPAVALNIVIQPQMSFGTGHHATTWLMLAMLLDADLHNTAVLDMGCGTGVLAIAAIMLGAKSALAIDIEDIAVDNTRDNARVNNVNICVEKGNGAAIGDRKFDLILANINKNVLRADMAIYTNALNPSGSIFLSGFFVSDTDELVAVAESCGLKFAERRNKDDWAALRFSLPPL